MDIYSANPSEALQNDMSEVFELVQRMQGQLSNVVVGQQQMLELLLASLLADGHVLIEGVPGVAKTLTTKLLSKMISAHFSRIQFTPDLMPSDIIGTSVYNAQLANFQFRKGPVFANMILIDEINRAPAKTQAALFEVMEERQITFDGICYPMASPFMVLATQNPIEHEGTYRLPEAQLDRFLMKIVVPYPSLEEEVRILEMQNRQLISDILTEIPSLVSVAEITEVRKRVRQVYIEDKIIAYIAQLIFETRNNRSVYVGASPRASVALLQVSKAIAAIRGRNFVIPEDVTYSVLPVLRHRISITPEREMDGSDSDSVLQEIIKKIEIPR